MTTIIDNVVGIICLPIGFLLLLVEFGVLNLTAIFGVSVLLVSALALLAIQASNLVATHMQGEMIIISYIVHILLTVPALLYFLSLIVALPSTIAAALPLMLACFIIVEGLYSFFF